MKKAKKILALLMVVVSLMAITVIPASAANEPTCATYGFSVDTSVYNKIGWTSYLKQNVYLGSTVIGTSNTIMLFATQKSKVGSEWMNVAMYYTMMTPTSSFSFKNIFGKYVTGTGRSDILEISTTLPLSSQSYRASYPENVAGSKTYTLGASAGASSSGVSANVTASTSITKNRLEVTNKSNVNQRKYQVLYNYKSAAVGTDSTNSYLKTQSTQRGTFYYQTSGSSFNFPLTVKAQFGHFAGIYHYTNDGNKTTTWNIAIA